MSYLIENNKYGFITLSWIKKVGKILEKDDEDEERSL